MHLPVTADLFHRSPLSFPACLHHFCRTLRRLAATSLRFYVSPLYSAAKPGLVHRQTHLLLEGLLASAALESLVVVFVPLQIWLACRIAARRCFCNLRFLSAPTTMIFRHFSYTACGIAPRQSGDFPPRCAPRPASSAGDATTPAATPALRPARGRCFRRFVIR